MTLAISHRDQHGRLILDCLREARAPFSPKIVTSEFAAILKAYNITRVTGDRYAGEWPRDEFKAHGITYQVSEQTKSDIYLALLPLLSNATVELLDHPRLLGQLRGLDRRVARGGKDSVDHGPRGHDDLSNAAAGSLVLAAAGGRIRSEAGKVLVIHHELRPVREVYAAAKSRWNAVMRQVDAGWQDPRGNDPNAPPPPPRDFDPWGRRMAGGRHPGSSPDSGYHVTEGSLLIAT